MRTEYSPLLLLEVETGGTAAAAVGARLAGVGVGRGVVAEGGGAAVEGVGGVVGQEEAGRGGLGLGKGDRVEGFARG